MFHIVTEEARAGKRLLNLFAFGEDFFLQQQIERRGRQLFMRAKKRLLPS